jgi:hypothetical protein
MQETSNELLTSFLLISLADAAGAATVQLVLNPVTKLEMPIASILSRRFSRALSIASRALKYTVNYELAIRFVQERETRSHLEWTMIIPA